MKSAYCHWCLTTHTDWQRGDIWQCRLCYFRIPAAHVWFPNTQQDAQTRDKTQDYEQLELGL